MKLTRCKMWNIRVSYTIRWCLRNTYFILILTSSFDHWRCIRHQRDMQIIIKIAELTDFDTEHNYPSVIVEYMKIMLDCNWLRIYGHILSVYHLILIQLSTVTVTSCIIIIHTYSFSTVTIKLNIDFVITAGWISVCFEKSLYVPYPLKIVQSNAFRWL